jgi:hypothetical protein
MANLTRTASNDNLVGSARNAIGMNDRDRVVSDELHKELTGGPDSCSGDQRYHEPDGAVTLARLSDSTNASLSDLSVPHGANT